MKSSSLIPADGLLLTNSIEAGASPEALAEGKKTIHDKRKGGSICIEYCCKRRRIKSEALNSRDLSFFDKYNNFQDLVILDHEAEVGDAMFSDCLANDLGSIATTDLVDKPADGCHESIQNDYTNGSMRENGLRKLTENVYPSLRDDLMDIFDRSIKPKGDTHMHNGDTDNSCVITEVEYAGFPDSLLSFSDKDYMVCILNTEDTLDDILNSQLPDSTENILKDPPFHGDRQDFCHREADVDLDNSSAVTEVEYASLPDSLLSFSDKDNIVCVLNTEDTNDDILNSQLLDSPENVLENPPFHGDQQDVCHQEADMESTSISHLKSDQLIEGKIICILNTEDLEIPCSDDISLPIHPPPSVRPETDTESIDPASSFTQSQMDGPDLSCEFGSANPHVGDTVKSVSMDHKSSISDHNNPDSDGDLPCFHDIENPEIPCNDNIFLLIHPSPPVTTQTAADSLDAASSSTQSQMDGLNLSSEFDFANPHAGNILKSVSMNHTPKSDHNNPGSDSDLPCFPRIENPKTPCNDKIVLPIHPSLSVGPQTASVTDQASSFTQTQMDGPDLSSEFYLANRHVCNTLKSVSMDHNPSISDHNDPDGDSDLPCFPDIENPEITCNDNISLLTHPSPSVRLQTAIGSIDLASSFARLHIDGPDLSSEFDSGNPHLGYTFKSALMVHNPSISDHNNPVSDSDLPCLPDIENPEIPCNGDIFLLIHQFPSVRPQTGTDSIDPASSFTRSHRDGPDSFSELDSAHPHVGNTLKSESMDHNPSISDHNNSDGDSDLPYFPDIEALILKLDFEYAQESWITNEAVKRTKYKHSNRTINRLEQSSSQRAMWSLGAFAVFYSHHFNYYIKKTEVTVCRSTDDTEVDIDLRKESHANMISRQQATIKMETDGTFTLKNIGKGSILMKGESITHGQAAALDSSCLIQIRGMDFMFEINDRHVRWYLDNIIKKTQGKFKTFEWSVTCG